MKIRNRDIKLIYILFIIVIIMLIIALVVAIQMDFTNTEKKEIIGENNLGSVSIEGPYGNLNSSEKIAFIIGVHPLESNSHLSLLNNIRKNNNSNNNNKNNKNNNFDDDNITSDKNKKLNKTYYIYIVNVTKDKSDFDKGHINGQLLARDYVVPDIKNKNYTFVVDVHSNRDVYKQKNFIIAPLNNLKSQKIGLEIIKNIEGVKILNYIPADDGHPTSPDYVSIPILKNGAPIIIYETSLNEPENTTDDFMKNFIENLDIINFEQLE